VRRLGGLLLVLLAATGSLPAQARPHAAGRVIHGTAVAASGHAIARLATGRHTAPGAVVAPAPGAIPFAGAAPPSAGTAPRRQAQLLAASPPPADSFAALGDDGTAIPPDTDGAVGPNQLVTALNSQVRVQDRSGGVISTTSLDSFFAATNGGSCNAVTHSHCPFDPHVLYDPYGGRFIAVAASDAGRSSSAILVQVSDDSDPSGSWFGFKVDPDPGSTLWADYPAVGFNKNWVVVQVNMFSISTDQFVRSQIYAFDKAKLYGNIHTAPIATMFKVTGGATEQPAATYSPSLATMYLVEDLAGNSGGRGFLRMSKITGAVGSETLTVGYAKPSTASTWHDLPSSALLPQSGISAKVDAGDARMLNCVWRPGAIWCTHQVFLPASGTATAAVAQWWQLSPAGAVLQRGRIGSAGSATDYAYPSIAVNALGDALVGYSTFSATQHPGAGYSFRMAGDAAGTMRSPVVLQPGAATYDKTGGSGANRWGDFSSTVVDPANDLDMWTLQEYVAAQDEWGTWWGHVVPPPRADLRLTVTDAPDPVTADATVTYTATVTNLGPDDADGVALSLTPPASVMMGAVSPSQGSCAGSAPIACDLGTLPASASASVTVQVTPVAPRTMALSAAVSATQDDPQTSNNAASAATTVKGAVATSYVSVTASGFSPAAAMIARGNAVQWNFLSGGSHSATDPHAPVLFDSGPRTPVDFYLSTPGFRFDWAGVFTVADTAGGLANGSVHVPVTASPSSGLRSTSFTITWANAPPPSGFVIEVQKRIPGGAWADWKAATTLLSATFKPGRTLGSYGFRSRLIDTVSGAVYGYSDVRSVMVHG
jgi:uncharacterized repeat protein (TIGR01451 family)